ncbi:hypothetical protein PV326_004593 [Microctonus aethiopoides]|nr:hypothetical protein PV326_004593 [Microctonus aethiopoides]
MRIPFAGCGLLFLLALVFAKIMDSVQIINCGETLITCKDGRDCIRKYMQCNGKKECQDGSDEDASFCSTYICPTHSLKCRDGRTCIRKNWWCDGEIDCPDGSDEDDESFNDVRNIIHEGLLKINQGTILLDHFYQQRSHLAFS